MYFCTCKRKVLHQILNNVFFFKIENRKSTKSITGFEINISGWKGKEEFFHSPLNFFLCPSVNGLNPFVTFAPMNHATSTHSFVIFVFVMNLESELVPVRCEQWTSWLAGFYHYYRDQADPSWQSFSPKFLLTAKIQTCLQHLSIYIQPEGDETQHWRLPLLQQRRQQQQQQQHYQVLIKLFSWHRNASAYCVLPNC